MNTKTVAPNGFAITALALGIFSLLFSLIPLLGILAIPVAVIGLIFAIVAAVLAFTGRRGRKVMAIVGGVLSLLALIVAMGQTKAVDDAVNDINGATASDLAEQPASSVTVGQVVTDGNLAITVKSVGCTTRKLNLSAAKGVYCIATVSTKNTGTESTTVDTTSWKLFAGATEYRSDPTASIEASQAGSGGFFNSLNPGVSMTTKVVYDVPKGTKPTAISVMDGSFGEGVLVALK